MSTTKPPRQRTPNQPRHAPTYPQLPADRYAALDPHEQQRHDAHRDIDAIFDAHPYARTDRDAHGFPQDTRLTDSPRHTDESALNAVEAWSQRPDPASDWLAEYAELRGLLLRVARLARYHFGFDPERDRNQTDRPTGRRNGIGKCVWCAEPAVQGRNEHGKPLVVQVDQQPIHNGTCYQQAWRAAQCAGTSIGAAIHQHANPANTANTARNAS